ncbi:prospero homeobox 3 isoform X1 [Hippocampus zosterae]|uniref:prospero homeobox 3 isoform X1 n=1 Tax=Hippocampus zosterae TaxID=109293 RepID=UPI00223D5A9F|nr:prospero homeobox 3 isoform X1 [Hippocampus zosterae]XP_051918357.1 prospero homeobox 3 isoform X1 [Hippocampus zosterae]
MMDSPSDLFDDSNPQVHPFAPQLLSAEVLGGLQGGGRPPPNAFRPLGFPLIQQHLSQSCRTPRGPPSAHLAVEREETEGQEGLSTDDEGKKRAGPQWSQDLARLKRMKLEEGGARRGGGGRELRRRRRAELKEQLEEARERLQALQEKVLRAFGESNTDEQEGKRNGNGKNAEDEVTAERMFDDDDEELDGGAAENEPLCLIAPFYSFKESEEKQRDGARTQRGRGEGATEGVGLWLDWDGGIKDEDDEGGHKFAQALKLELGSAVARVIDRVLRLYTDPSCRQAGVEDREARVEDEERPGGNDEERERPLQTMNSLPPHGIQNTDLALPPVALKSPDLQKARPFLSPPLPSHPDLSLHLPRPPLLLAPAPQPKEPSSAHPPSSSSSSSSSSSFPAPPLALPLLHYSMQQLFSRSLHQHPQMPPLPPSSRKDFLNSDPFLEFPTHPSFPPLPLLGHLGPSLMRHAHGGRERGVRGGGMMDGGELFLSSGGVYTQEGLSPCHLKKAKLMFFYARYPSSNTLKTYFPDVKFNRCVTSQMIKWFSNFREFFYIQMERFARQAVREALTRDGAPRLGRESQLQVGRDTELYRILNMHYNKSNIYQVPERFIEVSEVALREFHSAIWTGRDSDPCWKKGIYKIICKLDSSVPDAFRLPGCPVG